MRCSIGTYLQLDQFVTRSYTRQSSSNGAALFGVDKPSTWRDDIVTTWHGTVIENVHIYVNHKASVGDSGLNSAEVYKIRIPTDVENADQYLPPEEYAKLEDPEEHWTIQTDDQIVLGEYAQEIERPADLKDVRLRHCKVLSWSDNRFGGLPHWKIEGE